MAIDILLEFPTKAASTVLLGKDRPCVHLKLDSLDLQLSEWLQSRSHDFG